MERDSAEIALAMRGNIYGAVHGDRSMMEYFAGTLNINGQSDPTPLHVLAEWREVLRDGVDITYRVQELYPERWQGHAHWLTLATSAGRTVEQARQSGEPEVSPSQRND